jgi:antitoxin (DNA-binding transcriptional repressor) of toxin-antitoxin stability system
MTDSAQSVRVSNQELATVREAMRELHRLLARLEHGELEKIVLTQRNRMRAVLLTIDRYSEFERNAAYRRE